MDISQTNAVNTSANITPAGSSKAATKAGRDATTPDQNDKTAGTASPSTIVTLQSQGKTDDAGGNSTDSNKDSNSPSAVKSFTYGVLNLPDPASTPAPAQASDNGYFTAGRWAAAAVTVGTLISLVV